MYRAAIENLKKWKNKKSRKPLVIEGARQVGKTWLMKEFGRQEYEKTVYINFDADKRAGDLFSENLNPDRIIKMLEIYSGSKIDSDNTLIIFDEIQEAPRALSALKYFCEDAPQYHIVCAGSLLGIALHSGTSFPVGKVEFVRLYPLSFREFLMAAGREQYAQMIKDKDCKLMEAFKQEYITMLKQYYFVGGMPEAVQSFISENDFAVSLEAAGLDFIIFLCISAMS